jgi:hypothetical protein
MKTNMFVIFRNPKPNENYIIKRQSSKVHDQMRTTLLHSFQ